MTVPARCGAGIGSGSFDDGLDASSAHTAREIDSAARASVVRAASRSEWPAVPRRWAREEA